MNKTKEAILKTLVYADIFDYPLTTDEIKRFLIKTSNRHSGKAEGRIQNPDSGHLPAGASAQAGARMTKEILKQVQDDDYIESKDEFYFLKGRQEIVELRKKREKWSREKLKIAAKAASFLKFIPWIKMAGITGALAMRNTDKDDDIDILIVSAKNRIWLTRFLATILMEFLGKRRRPGICHPERSEGSHEILRKLRMTAIKNKICLNMYLDEAHLAVPKKEQDLFTAHEVVQVKLLWDKDQTYRKFLGENLWVKKYLPNATPFVIPAKAGIQTHREKPGFPIRSGMTGSKVFDFIENLARNFQLWYMRSRRTTEVISDGIIRFHPQDARKWVLTRYKDSLKIALIEKE